MSLHGHYGQPFARSLPKHQNNQATFEAVVGDSDMEKQFLLLRLPLHPFRLGAEVLKSDVAVAVVVAVAERGSLARKPAPTTTKPRRQLRQPCGIAGRVAADEEIIIYRCLSTAMAMAEREDERERATKAVGDGGERYEIHHQQRSNVEGVED